MKFKKRFLPENKLINIGLNKEVTEINLSEKKTSWVISEDRFKYFKPLETLIMNDYCSQTPTFSGESLNQVYN